MTVLPFENVRISDILNAWGSLRWRHHGIGVMQAYLSEGTDPEIRLHVWHPELVRPGIYASGSIHDHRFELVSWVLVGQLEERIFNLRPNIDGDWTVWNVENARSAGEARGFDGSCVPDLNRHYLADVQRRTHPAGVVYGLPRETFHETRVDDLAVTLVAMHDKRGQARLLVPRGREPVHAFGGAPFVQTQQEHIDAARQALERRAAVTS